MSVATLPSQLAPFTNEPYADFSKPENAQAARKALEAVRAQLGREYDLLIAGDRRRSSEKLQSLNPAKPSEVIGTHQKGTEQDARDAVEAAYAYFPKWAAVPVQERAEYLLRLAASYSRSQVRVRCLAGSGSRQDLG